MLLNAQQILSAADGLGGKTVEVEVPEWGGSVLVGSMGALERAELQDWLESLGRPKPKPDEAMGEPLTCDSPVEPSDDEPPEEREYSATENVQAMVRWCVLSILDPETRTRAFTSDDALAALGRKSTAALKRVYQAALELNLETEVSRKAAEKNSDGTPGVSSGGD